MADVNLYDRGPARVLFHLNGGYTKILFEDTVGSGQGDGGICWDIPTRLIPPHLRMIGSRFCVIRPTSTNGREELEIEEL
jgi:hypothetical protein